MNRPLVAVGAIVALLLVTAASCVEDEKSDIGTGTARLATVAEVVEAPASVTARTVATVTAPAGGRVGELYVADGEIVRAGDVLAVIDSAQTQRQLDQARRAVAAADSATVSTRPRISLVSDQRRTDTAAQNAFTTARQAAARIPDPQVRDATLAQVTVAETQYHAVATQARNAAAAVSRGLGSLGQAVNALSSAQRVQAQTAYELAAAQADALTLKAPIGGTVQLGGTDAAGGPDVSGLLSQLPANLQDQASQLGAGQQPAAPPPAQGDGSVAAGSLVGAGTAVATVVDVSALGLVAEVDETDVLLVKKGTTASVDLDAVPGATYRATVSAVGLLPTSSNQGGVSYRVRLRLAAGTFADGSAAPQPRPGMSAVTKLEVRKAVDAVAVPATAIVRDGDQDTVWVIERGRATRRTVTVGAQGEDLVQLTEGVTAGQRIVVRGADRVEPRQELR